MTELVNAITQTIREAGTRITTKDLANQVSLKLTGHPSVQLRKDHLFAVVYDTITKELAMMTGATEEGTKSPHYTPDIERDHKGGYWWAPKPRPMPSLFNPAPQKPNSIKVAYKPGKVGARQSTSNRSKVDAAAREYLPQLREAQYNCCSGCGREEPRDSHVQIDHIVPLRDRGLTLIGNLQMLCTGCHAIKTRGNYSQQELWNWLIANNGTWDSNMAVKSFAAIN